MKIGKLRQVNGFWNNLTFTGNMCRMRSALTNYLSEEGLKSRIEDGLVLFEFDDNHFCASFCMDEGYPECEITYEVEDGFTGGICTLFLNMFFNPCHQYRYCILLFFSGQLSSGRYMMPFGETSTTAAACSMLGYKYRMTSHRRLLAVIGDYGWSKTFGNEILCMLTDGFQALFCNIFLIPLRKVKTAAEC